MSANRPPPNSSYKMCRKGLHRKTPSNLYIDTRGAKSCKACYQAAREARRKRRISDDPLARLLQMADAKTITSDRARAQQQKGIETRRQRLREIEAKGPPATRTCRMCGVEKPLDQFIASKNCLWGRTHKCRPCHAEQNRAWRESNPGWEKAYNREWRRRNPERTSAYRRRWLDGIGKDETSLKRKSYEAVRKDPRRWRRIKEWSRLYMAARRSADDPSEAAEIALVELIHRRTTNVPAEIREAVRQDLFLRVQLRELSRLDLATDATSIKVSVRSAWKDMPDRWATISLDQPLTSDGDLTLADVLAEDT